MMYHAQFGELNAAATDGIRIESASEFLPIALSDLGAPGVPGEFVFENLSANFVVNENGGYAFIGWLDEQFSRAGIWATVNVKLTMVALERSPAPNTGENATFGNIARASINDNGYVLFLQVWVAVVQMVEGECLVFVMARRDLLC